MSTSNDHCAATRERLMDFLYELLEESEHAETDRHLEACDACREALSSARADKRILGTATRLDAPNVEFDPATADGAGAAGALRPARPAGGAGRRRIAAVVAAASLLVGATLAWAMPAIREARREAARREARAGQLYVTAQGPQPAAAGAPQQFIVHAKRGDGARAAGVEVSWTVSGDDGKAVVAEGQIVTDERGIASIDLPADALRRENGSFLGELTFAADAVSDDGVARGEVSATLGVDPIRHGAHVATDKPVYRPGEPVRFRATVLERFSLKPIVDGTPVRFRMTDARGGLAFEEIAVTDGGVVWADWVVPEGAAGGAWGLAVESLDGGFPRATHDVMVRAYRAPRLKKQLELRRSSYGPGDEVVADLSVERAEGGAAAGATLRANATVDGAVVASWTATADAGGAAVLRFTLPDEVSRGDALLSVGVDDGGTVETVSEPVRVLVGKVEVELFPEGGVLVAGLPSRVYLRARTPTGEPADASGRIEEIESGKTVARFETIHEGLGRFEVTPEAGRTYRIVVEEPAGVTAVAPPAEPGAPSVEATLPAPEAEGFVIASAADVIDAAGPMRLTVHSTRDQAPLAVSAFCRGTLVAQTTLVANRGANEVVLEPRAALGPWGGVVRVTVYDRKLAPVAERLVYRSSGRQVRVAIEPDRAKHSPGDPVRVRVRTFDENGEAIPAMVGLSVVDDSVIVLADDERPGLRTSVLLASELDEIDRTEFYLSGDPEAAEALDMLLGTQGWRRFIERDVEAFLAEHDELARRLIALSGIGRTVVGHNGAEVGAAIAAARDGGERPGDATPLLGGALVLLALVISGVLFVAGGVATLSRGEPGVRALGPLVGVVVSGTILAVLAFPGPVESYRRTARFDANGDRALLGPSPDDDGLLDQLQAEVLREEIEKNLEEFAFAFERADNENGLKLAMNAELENANGLLAEGILVLEDIELEEEVVVAKREELAKFLADDLVADAEKLDEVRKLVFEANKQRARAFDREFAHRRAPRSEADAGVRSDFTECLYWNAALQTGARGEAEISFDLSDAVTTFRVRAEAHAHGGRLGGGEGSFESRVPFYLEPKLPLEVSAGDRIDLPLAVVNDLDEQLGADLELTLSGAELFELGGPSATRHATLVPGKRLRMTWPITVRQGQGDVRLAFAGTAGRLSDRVERSVAVVSRGFPAQIARSGVLENVETIAVALPEDTVAGSVVARLRLFPSTLSTLEAGIEGMMREPGGCFEQASSTNYPNVMALQYLQGHDGAVDPAFAQRARGLLDRGYQLLSGYECSKKGYEWFGGDPGHEALTAYGLMEFVDMAEVHEDVDPAMIDRTAAWLLARRDGEGGFTRNPRALDSFGGAPEQTTTAYIVWAITEAGDRFEIDAELDALAKMASKSEDTYVVALAANALLNRGHSAAPTLLAKLVAAQDAETGKLGGAVTSITRSGGTNLEIETTALAVLAFLRDPKREHTAQAELGVRSILEQRSAGGNFYATQATVLALKALVAHAKANARPLAAGMVIVTIDGVEVARKAFDESHRGAIDVDGLADHLAMGREHEVLVKVTGEGNAFPFTLGVEYRSETPPSSDACAVGLSVKLAERSVQQGATVPLSAKVTNRRDEGIPMVVAIIGLPAGLEPIAEQLETLRERGTVDFYETRKREVILYWRAMAPNAEVAIELDLAAAIPGEFTGPASRAYLYYDDEAKTWIDPLQAEVTRPDSDD